MARVLVNPICDHDLFLLWTAGGALIWNIILAYAGYVLGQNFRDIDKYVGPAATACIVGAVILYLWRLAAGDLAAQGLSHALGWALR